MDKKPLWILVTETVYDSVSVLALRHFHFPTFSPSFLWPVSDLVDFFLLFCETSLVILKLSIIISMQRHQALHGLPLRLWESVLLKAPMHCHVNGSGWWFGGEVFGSYTFKTRLQHNFPSLAGTISLHLWETIDSRKRTLRVFDFVLHCVRN